MKTIAVELTLEELHMLWNCINLAFHRMTDRESTESHRIKLEKLAPAINALMKSEVSEEQES